MFKKTGTPSAKVLSVSYPIIKINATALMKMRLYCAESSEEVGWLCYVRKDGNVYTISDTVMVEQETSAVTADLHEEGLQKLASKLIKEGKEDLLDLVKGWGHSHVNMAVSPSGTDDETFEQFYQHCPFFIRIICNKKDEMRIDLMNCEEGIQYDNMNWTVLYDKEIYRIYQQMESLEKRYVELQGQFEDALEKKEKSLKESVKKEIADNVKKKSYAHGGKYKYSNPYFESGYGWETDRWLNYDETYSIKKTKEEDEEEEDEEEEDELIYKSVAPFNTAELNYIHLNVYTTEDLIEEYYDDQRFFGYTQEDWEDLFSILLDEMWTRGV